MINIKNKVGDFLKILKYKINFAKRDTPNWSEEVAVVKKAKNNVICTYVIADVKVSGNPYDDHNLVSIVRKKMLSQLFFRFSVQR